MSLVLNMMTSTWLEGGKLVQKPKTIYIDDDDRVVTEVIVHIQTFQSIGHENVLGIEPEGQLYRAVGEEAGENCGKMIVARKEDK